MGDFEPDKGSRQAEHLIWSRRSPYAHHMQGRYTPAAPLVRPLPGASGCEGPINPRVAAVPDGDPVIGSWNPGVVNMRYAFTISIDPFYTLEDVDVVDPSLSEGLFVNRGNMTVDNFPAPAFSSGQGPSASEGIAREPALEDDPGPYIGVPVHHNARLYNVTDSRAPNFLEQFWYYSGWMENPDVVWPPPPMYLEMEGVPGYAYEPCRLEGLDCCEHPEDPATVSPTWKLNRLRQVTHIFYGTNIFNLVYRSAPEDTWVLESMAVHYTPEQWDDGTFNPGSSSSLLPNRPGLDEREPGFMEHHYGNLFRIPNEEGDFYYILNNAPTLNYMWEIQADAFGTGSPPIFDVFKDPVTGRIKHSLLWSHVFAQNHETDHFDLVLPSPYLPFFYEPGWTVEEPDLFAYNTTGDRDGTSTISPVTYYGGGESDSYWALRVHLYKPAMRWYPYDAAESGTAPKDYWRMEIDLDIDDDTEVEWLLTLTYFEDGGNPKEYDSGYIFYGNLTQAEWSDLIDTIIAEANANSDFNLERQPDEGGKAVIHVSWGSDAPADELDTLDYYLDLDGWNGQQIVANGEVGPYTEPPEFDPKTWCMSAVEEVDSYRIAGPEVSDHVAMVERGLRFIDVWGNEMPVEWFDGDEREVGGSGGGVGPFFHQLHVARVRVPLTIPPGIWAIGFSWEWSDGGEHPPWDVGWWSEGHFPLPLQYLFIPDQGPRCIPWMTPTGGSDCALGSLPPLD